MEWYLYLIIGVVLCLVVFVGVVLIRTLNFKPKKQANQTIEKVEFDKEQAVECLRQIIRCKTISNEDKEKEDENEFNKLIDLLPKLYPNVFEKCELKKFEGRALLFRLKGKSSEKPSVLMSHYDVVSVDEENWQKPPFEGIIEDGVLWGRGTLDTKVTFNATMFSVNKLIGDGFVPENDIYLAFSGGEEVNGDGARNIVKYFKENNITPEMVIDEGGAVVENIFPGVSKPCGLVGIAEKGMINLKYTVKSAGGHASAPKPNSPIVKLSKACLNVEQKPFKMHLTKPVAEMFDTLGRESTFVYRMIFANLWLFKGVLNKMCIKNGGEMNALMRTTVAFTQTKGSKGMNVIPPQAEMVANMRLNPEDNVQSAVEYIKSAVNDDSVKLEVLMSNNPSRISRTDVVGYDRVVNAIKGTWDNVIVSPYLMVQCSDSRHYGEITDRVYRFSAMDLTAEERSTIHGNNERIRLETICNSVEFYIRLVKQC